LDAVVNIGLYAGSFDPFQLGHLDIAIRAAGLLDALYIGVGVNPDKHGGLFAPTDRVEMVPQTLNWHLRITPSDAQALADATMVSDPSTVRSSRLMGQPNRGLKTRLRTVSGPAL
jgi:cytidyltransferase-like protein